MSARRRRSLMVLGTASHVGKSVLAAALCRILKQDGFRVAPFKAQNMALNSAATPEGLEIGRAQAMQAEAAGIAPAVDMNPILLKPCGESRSQLVVRGRVAGVVSAREYHATRVQELFDTVVDSHRRLLERYDAVVIEGAGSPAEVNLADSDIVNMRMARAADAACILVSDIDRGGVFGALVGTMALLPPADRRRIRGFVVNRFRGDPALFAPGVAFLEKRLARPCLGVVPYLPQLGLDEEDSVALQDFERDAPAWRDEGPARPLRIAVVALPRLSNFTDFAPLGAEPSVALRFARTRGAVEGADVVVLPGSKQTLDDLEWLEGEGLAAAVREHHRRGGTVLGICGGMQMLGREICDPQGMEGGGARAGLGLLGLRTALASEKVTVRARAVSATSLFGASDVPPIDGYEIHLGATEYDAGTAPLFRVRREGAAQEVDDGAQSADGRVAGTYLHGLFDSDAFRHVAIQALRARAGLAPADVLAPYTAERERRFDRLADFVRQALDVERIEGWLR